MTVRADRRLAVLDVCDERVRLSSSGVEVDLAIVYLNYVKRPVAGVANRKFLVHEGSFIETDHDSIVLLTRYLGVDKLDEPVEFKGFDLVPNDEGDVRVVDKKGAVLSCGTLKAPIYYGVFMNVGAFLEREQNYVVIDSDWGLGLRLVRVNGRYLMFKEAPTNYRTSLTVFETYPYILKDLLSLRGGGSKHRHYISFKDGMVSFSGEGVERVNFGGDVGRVFERGYKMLERFGHLSRVQATAEIGRRDMDEYSCSWG